MQTYLHFNILSIDWSFQRRYFLKQEILKEVERKNKMHIKRSASAKEAWQERKTKH